MTVHSQIFTIEHLQNVFLRICHGRKFQYPRFVPLQTQLSNFTSLQYTIHFRLVANATKELQPGERRIDHRKKTAIEILAAIAVSVLVGIVSPRYLENLTPTTSTLLAFIALISLLVIILTRNRDKSS